MQRISIAMWTIWMISCSGGNSRVQSALDAMARDQKNIAAQVVILSRRLMVLEAQIVARKGTHAHGSQVHRVAKQPQSELEPDELPTVTLRPQTKIQPSTLQTKEVGPDRVVDDDALEEPTVSEDQPTVNHKRVVLRLEGSPTNQEVSSGPKPLPLGKFVPLREPDETASEPPKISPSRSVAGLENAKKGGADALYRIAMEHYEARQYALALTLFSRVEKEYPNHTLVANAVFWQGECHFQNGKFELAMALFQRVIDKYPRSAKVPDAMYKLGISMDKMGQSARAREILAQVIELVPQTPLAAKAAVYLQKMR